MIYLDNHALERIASDQKFIAEFPILARRQKHLTKCCGGVTRHLLDYNHIKAALANMPEDRKQRFKELFGNRQIVILYNDGRQSRKVIV